MGFASCKVRSTALLACIALAACVPPSPQTTPRGGPSPAPGPAPASSPAPAAVGQPVQAPLPAPPASAIWQDAPATPGDWQYRTAGAERIADFVSPAGGQIFQFICTGNRTITLTVIARVPGASAITIRTEHFDRALAANANENAVSAALSPGDLLLDAMAFSKGRFAVEVAGGPQLFLPAYPEVTRVIEECRA